MQLLWPSWNPRRVEHSGVWEQYGTYFSPHLQRHINRLRANLTVSVTYGFAVSDGSFSRNGDGR